jgi:hypothetical protein
VCAASAGGELPHLRLNRRQRRIKFLRPWLHVQGKI